MKNSKFEIGERLKLFSEKNYKTDRHFAEALGILPQTLTKYFSGISVPGGEVLSKISELGCDLHWLLTGENKAGDVNTSNSSGVKYATGTGRHTQIYHMNDTKEAYNAGELEILKTENERLKSELKKAERIIELLEKK